MPSPKCVAADVRRLTLKSEIGNLKSEIARASYSENGIGGNARPHPAFAGRSQSGHLQQNCYGGRRPGPTAIELRRTGFFPILIVILLLISKNLSRARLRLGLRLRACQCGPAAGLNSMAVLPHPGEGEARTVPGIFTPFGVK